MKKVILYLSITLFLVSCSTAEKKNNSQLIKKDTFITIKEDILRIFNNRYNDFLTRFNINHENTYKEKEFEITGYVGNVNNIYAVTLTPYSTPWFGIDYIKIGDYVSNTLYSVNSGPFIYQNRVLYEIDEALNKKIIDLEFVKTFDSFQLLHSVDELDEIYICVE